MEVVKIRQNQCQRWYIWPYPWSHIDFCIVSAKTHDDDDDDVWYVADLKDRHHTRQREIHEGFQTLASDWGFDAHRRDVRVDDDVDVDDDDFRVGDDVEVDDIRVDDDDNDDSDDKPDAEIMIVRPGSWRRWRSREFSNPRIGRFCLGSHCKFGVEDDDDDDEGADDDAYDEEEGNLTNMAPPQV